MSGPVLFFVKYVHRGGNVNRYGRGIFIVSPSDLFLLGPNVNVESVIYIYIYAATGRGRWYHTRQLIDYRANKAISGDLPLLLLVNAVVLGYQTIIDFDTITMNKKTNRSYDCDFDI